MPSLTRSWLLFGDSLAARSVVDGLRPLSVLEGAVVVAASQQVATVIERGNELVGKLHELDDGGTGFTLRQGGRTN